MSVRKERTIKLISIAIVTVIFVLAVILTIQFVRIGNLQAKRNELQNQLSETQRQIMEYSSLNDYVLSDEFLQEYARNHLGLGNSGTEKFK